MKLAPIEGSLDPKIAPIVKLLRAHNVNTTASCQGGKGHALKLPWVTIDLTHLPGLRQAQRESERIRAVLHSHGYNNYLMWLEPETSIDIRSYNRKTKEQLARTFDQLYSQPKFGARICFGFHNKTSKVT